MKLICSKCHQGIKAMNICGLSVTIPHKVAIMPFLDEIDPLAKQIGAVNTVKNVEGTLYGRNTDGEGCLKAIKDAGEDDYTVVTRKELHRRLSELQKAHAKKLYVKLIIPDDSGLSYNEAWGFTMDILEKYDYYHQD